MQTGPATSRVSLLSAAVRVEPQAVALRPEVWERDSQEWWVRLSQVAGQEVRAFRPERWENGMLQARFCLFPSPQEGREWIRMGLLCRVQPQGQGYVFLVTGSGYYGVVALREQGPEVLGPETGALAYLAPWPSEPAPCRQVTAACEGPWLRMWIDHRAVAQVQDESFPGGRAGWFFSAGKDVPKNGWLSIQDAYMWIHIPAP